ncbi:hypothetical protein CEQ15_05990 [Chryseobacterium indologenes]|nr:hypothetical protein CEQ15_05990 [Chryseobacterium indologenes]
MIKTKPMKKITILFLIHISLLFLSQTKPPESYSLIRGVNESINLNRGLVDLTLPLFDITEGGFKLSNSLNYESRGFVPYLYPSFVGLNWNLNQFGKITRESRKIDFTTTANKILNPFYGHSGGSLNYLQYSSFQYDDVRSYDRNDCIKTVFANNAKKKQILIIQVIIMLPTSSKALKDITVSLITTSRISTISILWDIEVILLWIIR